MDRSWAETEEMRLMSRNAKAKNTAFGLLTVRCPQCYRTILTSFAMLFPDYAPSCLSHCFQIQASIRKVVQRQCPKMTSA